MLPFGKLRVTSVEGGGAPSKFTPDEQQTVMTLWSVFRSPLIFGGDLPSNDAATTTLIANEEVIDVNQHSHGGRQALERGNIRVWVADAAGPGERYVAAFNLGEKSETVELEWSEIGIADPVSEVHDLWSHATLGPQRRLRTELRPHASVLYRVASKPN
jgi:alpha-galactosidase